MKACKMTIAPTWLAISILGIHSWGCTSLARSESECSPIHSRHESARSVQASDTIRKAVNKTMLKARQAVSENGVTDAAMDRIRDALANLARHPGLKEEFTLRQLHGGGTSVALLSSEGEDGLTLTLARFEAGTKTAIHDHGTWAIAFVVEGSDEYIQWERVDDGADAGHATLRVKFKKLLGPGDSVYWLDPPHDIHSQEAKHEVTWELVLFGKNPLASERQYFDPETGRVTKRWPQ